MLYLAMLCIKITCGTERVRGFLFSEKMRMECWKAMQYKGKLGALVRDLVRNKLRCAANEEVESERRRRKLLFQALILSLETASFLLYSDSRERRQGGLY